MVKNAFLIAWNYNTHEDQWLKELLETTCREGIPDHVYNDLQEFVDNSNNSRGGFNALCQIDYINDLEASYNYVSYYDENTDLVYWYDLSGLSKSTINSIIETYTDMYGNSPDMNNVKSWLFEFLYDLAKIESDLNCW